MLVTHLPPCPALAAFVKTFTVVETREEEATKNLLPDAGMVIGIRFAGFARQLDEDAKRNLPDASLAGMRACVRRMYTSAHAGVVLAAFHTGGAAAFFAEPLHELFGKTAALDAFIPRRSIQRTTERVASACNHTERVHALEQLLLERLRANVRDRVVTAALSAIADAKGSLRIGELASALDLSRDRFEKRFRSAVGSSPKQLASLLRIKYAIALHQSGASLTDSALEAGYFDQSHFNREFHQFTGESPTAFFSKGDHC